MTWLETLNQSNAEVVEPSHGVVAMTLADRPVGYAALAVLWDSRRAHRPAHQSISPVVLLECSPPKYKTVVCLPHVKAYFRVANFFGPNSIRRV